jgi:hypothetical protein
MANYRAIYDCGESLLGCLRQSYDVFRQAPGNNGLPTVTFKQIGSSAFSGDTKFEKAVTLYLHRIALDPHVRNARGGRIAGPVGLDLHYLLTVWLDTVQDEHHVLGWLLGSVYTLGALDRRLLAANAGWEADEVLSLVPGDLTIEELHRIWESGRRPYRQSHPLIVRVVRLDRTFEEGAPVVAARLAFSDKPGSTSS